MKDWLEKLKFILGIAKEEIDETEDNVFTEKSNIETPDEDAPEDEAKTLKGSLIKILAGGIIVVGVASVFSNFMTTPAEKRLNRLIYQLSIPAPTILRPHCLIAMLK